MELKTENERLQHDNASMSANFNRKLDAQEDLIKSLNARLENASNTQDYEEIYRRENESLKQENKMLRDKVSDQALSGQQHQSSAIDAIESENRRLRADLEDKEREFSR